MSGLKFKEGDKVQYNAGWSKNISVLTKKPVGWMWRGPYDFGWYTKTGDCLLFEEGERGIQSSFIVPKTKVRKYEQG